MDNIGHKSGHLMLITPERVFYAGLLGRPRQRCSGAFNIYVSFEGGLWLTTADGRESYGSGETDGDGNETRHKANGRMVDL